MHFLQKNVNIKLLQNRETCVCFFSGGLKQIVRTQTVHGNMLSPPSPLFAQHPRVCRRHTCTHVGTQSLDSLESASELELDEALLVSLASPDASGEDGVAERARSSSSTSVWATVESVDWLHHHRSERSVWRYLIIQGDPLLTACCWRSSHGEDKWLASPW